MTDKEFDERLKRIAETAKAQAAGAYTPQSDAMQALQLIETLALLLIENHEAYSGVARVPVDTLVALMADARLAASQSAELARLREENERLKRDMADDAICLTGTDLSVLRASQSELNEMQAQVWAEVDRLRDQLSAALADRDRLQGVVDKLPKTADGFLVVPGMDLWTVGNDANEDEPESIVVQKYYAHPSDRMVWMGPKGSTSGSGPHDLREYYSSEAAALAASQDQTKKENP